MFFFIAQVKRCKNWTFNKELEHTVDGRNPAPPGMVKTL